MIRARDDPTGLTLTECELLAQSAAPTPSSSEPAREPHPVRMEGLRRIRDEIRHILRRCKQIEEAGREWSSIWPHAAAPYRLLPAEQWNRFGASLNLPGAFHDQIQEAYEMANDFNVVMQRGPRHFGDREPDLRRLKLAFEQAGELIEGELDKT